FGARFFLLNSGPLAEDERLFRIGRARFDVDSHRADANFFEKKGRDEVPFAAAYHRGQLALHEPADAKLWSDFLRDSDQLADDRLAFQTLNLAAIRSPDVAEVYRQRSRLRAKYFQTAEATADQIVGLVLAARAGK